MPLTLAASVQTLHGIAVDDHARGASFGNQLRDPAKGCGGNPERVQFSPSQGLLAGVGAEEFHG
jgi:hypothetical protein